MLHSNKRLNETGNTDNLSKPDFINVLYVLHEYHKDF